MTDIKAEILQEFRKKFVVPNSTGEELIDQWCADHIEDFIVDLIDRIREEEKRDRQQIALEEYRKQPFETLMIPFLGHAGNLMIDTNADAMRNSVVVTLKDGKRYKVEVNYKLSLSNEK